MPNTTAAKSKIDRLNLLDPCDFRGARAVGILLGALILVVSFVAGIAAFGLIFDTDIGTEPQVMAGALVALAIAYLTATQRRSTRR